MKSRFLLPLAATAALVFTGCQNSLQNQEAVRRGVMDHLAKAGLSTENMDVGINSVQFHDNQAEADVEVKPKGATHGQGVQMHYGLETQQGKWVVTRSSASGAHGGAPGAANPHGDGAMPAMPPDHGAMPSPQDLPPAKKR